MKKQKDAPGQTKTYPFPVVGIGASAGGLAALEQFVKAVPLNSGMAFVVVQHLSHEFKSLMDTLLARHTDMPIHIVKDGMPVEQNKIFLIPSGTLLTIYQHHFRLEHYKADKKILRYPIDIFFRSLAEEVKESAVGVVLSGAGSDGSRGVVEIDKNGGLVIVQDSATARFDMMPSSAYETGVVDLVLAPDEMFSAIKASLSGHSIELKHGKSEDNEIISAENAFSYILNLLQDRFRVDFNHYKLPTMLRRIERRMQMGQFHTVESYVEFMRGNAKEIDALYRDLLVDVTRFYRDIDAFKWLESKGLPLLLNDRKPEEPFRIWVAGCATGEEAYSVASLVQQFIDSQGLVFDFQLFATDLHEDSIRKAALGVFDIEFRQDIPDPIFERYFFEENGRIYVEQFLRKKIIFSTHDLLKDSPFTNLDLICCRNVLIYLNSEAQQRVLQQFNFGLNKKGLLFLGPSEFLGPLKSEFRELNRLWRIFQKLSNRRVLDVTSINLTRQSRVRSGLSRSKGVTNEVWHDQIFARFVPDSILVDFQWYLVRTFGGVSQYLSLPTGRVDLLVTRLIHPDLVTPLRASLYRASQEKLPTAVEKVIINLYDRPTAIHLNVIPIRDGSTPNDATAHIEPIEFFLIVLEKMDIDPVELPEQQEQKLLIDSQDANYIGELERELMFTRESLQATIEELETTNEELQSSNEELLAANEELQSTNEELQSVNEELHTVNSEYQIQNEQLTQLNQDVENYQKSSRTISIFLDEKYTITEFTPNAGSIFGLLPHDKGRSILALLLFEYVSNDQLKQLFEDVLNGQDKHILTLNKNSPLSLEILPMYDGEEARIVGIIINVMDISHLINPEMVPPLGLNISLEDRLTSPVEIFHYIYDVRAQKLIFTNDAIHPILGIFPKEAYQIADGTFFNEVLHPEDRAEFIRKITTLDEAPDGTVVNSLFRLKHADGRWIWIQAKENCFGRNSDSQILQILGNGVDVTERVENEQKIRQLEEELATLKQSAK